MEAMIHRTIKISDTKILIWKLTETWEELLKQFDKNEIDSVEFSTFHTDKRKKEYLSVRLALKTLLNRKIKICYNDDGKPFLSDYFAEIGISHSGQWIAVITHPTQKVGIDVERFQSKILAISERFLSQEELEKILEDKEEKLKKLTLLWSAKEALFKVIGKEAVDFSRQLLIFPFRMGKSGKMKALHIPRKKLYELNYELTEEYALVYLIDNMEQNIS